MSAPLATWLLNETEDIRTMKKSRTLDTIRMQVMWNRLISVVEEQAQALMRTAFSPIVRECGDLSAGVFDAETDSYIHAQTYNRSSLQPGSTLTGPAIVIESQTSTFVPGGFSLNVSTNGHLVVKRDTGH